MSSSSTQTVHKKRLEGVRRTDTLKDLLDQSLSLVAATREEEGEDPAAAAEEKDDDANGDILLLMPLCRPLSKKKARSILLEFKEKKKMQQEEVSSSAKDYPYDCIPIPVLRSMATLLGEDRVEQALEQQQQQQEDSTTYTTTLVFTSPASVEPTLEQQRFRKRMERLRLKAEECQYRQLTQNLGNKVQADDDITTRSMTYAASIGLNMIIAPLSFGCFMYFFAGGLLDYFFPIDEELHRQHHHHAPVADIRKVIAGVVSGVLMLFVEMILFVIRTHEMDKAMRRKAKKSKKKVMPFGYYTAMTTKTYKED